MTARGPPPIFFSEAELVFRNTRTPLLTRKRLRFFPGPIPFSNRPFYRSHTAAIYTPFHPEAALLVSKSRWLTTYPRPYYMSIQ